MSDLEKNYQKINSEMSAFINKLDGLKQDPTLDLDMDEVQKDSLSFLEDLQVFQGTDYVEKIMNLLEQMVLKIDELSGIYEDMKKDVQNQLSAEDTKLGAHKAYMKTQYS